jgi:coiled-coil domain-containing protein 63/114
MIDLGSSDPRKLELSELQRQHKHMELERRAYSDESQTLLRKQQSTIDKLRKDNDSIKADISVLMRSTCRPLSSLQQDAMHKMQDQGDKYATAIEYEMKNIEMIEDQINAMKQKCQHQRRAMGGVNASKDNFYMIQKQIRILENRLDKALIKFNEAIAHNKVLRDDIDDLRRERVVFENIYRKMERELQDRKQKMAEIIESSNQSYEQRDTYQMEVAAVEQANRKEQEEFEEQMVELARMLESGEKNNPIFVG